MATANFSIPNTKKHYCIFNNDSNYWDFGGFESDLDYLRELLDEEVGKIKKLKTNHSDFEFYTLEKWLDNYHLNFAKVDLQDLLKDGDYTGISINFIIENGYYDGVMFDWEIDDQYGEREESLLFKYTEKTIERILITYERLLEKFVTHKLQRVASLSNGETIYNFI